MLHLAYCLGHDQTGSPILKPNYQYEKRQRELEKKKKKAEKALKKSANTETPPATEAPVPPKPE